MSKRTVPPIHTASWCAKVLTKLCLDTQLRTGDGRLPVQVKPLSRHALFRHIGFGVSLTTVDFRYEARLLDAAGPSSLLKVETIAKADGCNAVCSSELLDSMGICAPASQQAGLLLAHYCLEQRMAALLFGRWLCCSQGVRVISMQLWCDICVLWTVPSLSYAYLVQLGLPRLGVLHIVWASLIRVTTGTDTIKNAISSAFLAVRLPECVIVLG